MRMTFRIGLAGHSVMLGFHYTRLMGLLAASFETSVRRHAGRQVVTNYIGNAYMRSFTRTCTVFNPEFKMLHFKDLCHLMNNALEGGIRISSFNVVHNFVVHFPAMLNSSRELSRFVSQLTRHAAERWGGFRGRTWRASADPAIDSQLRHAAWPENYAALRTPPPLRGLHAGEAG
ncbi:hypothetical protein HPB51_025716 [Rhipicephalus microplus]|uniref:Uncharacterized protein n=1 Tax=Rhipicephalus microplus TaxID=6941 RepID=A0A9J6EKC7_RHIMP|nr:hypothetical protein HPB51_025716 [Rhipicephalus microplus]